MQLDSVERMPYEPDHAFDYGIVKSALQLIWSRMTKSDRDELSDRVALFGNHLFLQWVDVMFVRNKE